MKIWIAMLMVIVVGVGGALAGYWYGAHHGHSGAAEEATTQPADEEDKPVVPVVTEPLKVSKITETVTAYGTVVAEAADVRAVSVPFESRVVQVLVTPGQHVTPRMPLVKTEASPDALVGLQEAKNAVDATARDLKSAQERFAEHLATNVELSAAQVAAESAKLKLQSLQQRGVGENHELKAEVAGIVSKVDIQEGQIVPAGGPLVELAAGNRIDVRLNVEPADAQALAPGAQVTLGPLNALAKDKPIVGKVRMIGERVDPTTRLVELRVTLPADAHLMLDSFVTGQITRAAAQGFVVPRDAALPDEDGTSSLFTVHGDHAVLHKVRVGLVQDQLVQVTGENLKAGDPVVVSGNSLLEDGMEVRVQEPATQPATQSTETTAEALR